jgi:hypothetical protein
MTMEAPLPLSTLIVVRAAHLLPVFGRERVSTTLSFTDTLDAFTRFYVNRFVDHHAFEIVF